jgi:hypothetical protein
MEEESRVSPQRAQRTTERTENEKLKVGIKEKHPRVRV